MPNCLLVSDLIDLNSIIGEETELKEVDHGEKEFEIDDIISNVGYLGSNWLKLCYMWNKFFFWWKINKNRYLLSIMFYI